MIPNKEELLAALLKENEGHTIEFKENNLDKERLGSYISALSNMALYDDKEYAYLIYGIKDATKDVAGTTLDLEKEKVGNISLLFWINSLLTPRDVFDYDTLIREDKRIVIIRIKKASGSLTLWKGDEYGRINDSLVSLKNEVALKKELWAKVLLSVNESDVALSSVSSGGIETYLDVRGYYKLMKQPFPADYQEAIKRMLGEGFIKARDDSHFDITVLGALCIATSLSLFPSLGSKVVEAVRYESPSRVSSTSIPLVYDSGYLLSFERMIEDIVTMMGAKETVKRGMRVKEEPIPALIVREMLSNAIIHQSIEANSGKILVECFPSRLEIFNPGKLGIDPMRIIDMAPFAKNRHLVEILSRYGIGEGHGTGFDKIVASSEANFLPPPMVKEEQYGVRVIAYCARDWKDYSLEEKKRATYYHVTLAYINGEKASNETLRNRFGLSSTNKAQISRLLKTCVEEGLIKRSSEATGARNSYYIPYWA